MSKWAQKRKRKLVIAISLSLLVMLSLIVYSQLKVTPTCFDRAQNGLETGVDCGGGCQLVCSEDIRDIVVWWERPFKVANGVFNAVAYFENQNLESGLQEIAYEFRLYNYDNVIVSEPIVGKTFIEPNKRSAVFESGISTGSEDAYVAFFKIASVQNWEKVDQKYGYSFFQIGDPLLSNQDVSPRLEVSIKNTTLEALYNIPVVAIIYNQDNNAIGASQTYIDELKHEESKIAYFSWPEPFGQSASRIEIIPRLNPFEN